MLGFLLYLPFCIIGMSRQIAVVTVLHCCSWSWYCFQDEHCCCYNSDCKKKMCHVIIYCCLKSEKTKSTTEVILEKLNSRSIYEGTDFVSCFSSLSSLNLHWDTKESDTVHFFYILYKYVIGKCHCCKDIVVFRWNIWLYYGLHFINSWLLIEKSGQEFFFFFFCYKKKEEKEREKKRNF